MRVLRLELSRAALGPIAWASLFALATTQATLLIDLGHQEHSYCPEHEGAVHHLDGQQSAAQSTPLALKSATDKKSAAGDLHDHCEALGTGLRPALKLNKPCTPRSFEKKTLKRPLEQQALPVNNEAIYAFAPKASPPRV